MPKQQEYKKRQHRRNRSETKNDGSGNSLSKSKVEKPKKRTITSQRPLLRFGRAREKSIRKKKNDGLKSHVKIQNQSLLKMLETKEIPMKLNDANYAWRFQKLPLVTNLCGCGDLIATIKNIF